MRADADFASRPGPDKAKGIVCEGGFGGTLHGNVLGTDIGASAGVDADRLLAGGNPSKAVFLAPSAIEVMNRPGGVFDSGLLLDVAQFSNRGTLSVGGSGLIGTTRLTGDLSLAGFVNGAVLQVDSGDASRLY